MVLELDEDVPELVDPPPVDELGPVTASGTSEVVEEPTQTPRTRIARAVMQTTRPSLISIRNTEGGGQLLHFLAHGGVVQRVEKSGAKAVLRISTYDSPREYVASIAAPLLAKGYELARIVPID